MKAEEANGKPQKFNLIQDTGTILSTHQCLWKSYFCRSTLFDNSIALDTSSDRYSQYPGSGVEMLWMQFEACLVRVLRGCKF